MVLTLVKYYWCNACINGICNHLHIESFTYIYIYLYISRIDISVYCLTFGLGPWKGLELYRWQLAVVPSSVVLIISRSSLTFVQLSTSTCNKSGFKIKRHTKLIQITHTHTHRIPFFFLLPPSPDIPTYPHGKQHIPSQSALLKMMKFPFPVWGDMDLFRKRFFGLLSLSIYMYYIYIYM